MYAKRAREGRRMTYVVLPATVKGRDAKQKNGGEEDTKMYCFCKKKKTNTKRRRISYEVQRRRQVQRGNAKERVGNYD